jgi:hypothetical protein
MAVAEKKAPKAAAKATKPASMGMQIDALFKLRERLQEIQQQEKDQQALIDAATATLMETMERDGVSKSTGKLATVSISDTVTGNVVDWDAFGAYVIKNKYLHLLQRRLSDPAIRELFESKGSVPGVEPFTKRRLNVRKVA